MKGLIIIPVIDNLAMTLDTIDDSLQQLGGAAEVLVINQGSTRETRAALEAKAATRPRLTVITHDPPLPALAATWNAALDYAWATGHDDALVVNNDIRMAPSVYEDLRRGVGQFGLYFASPVNVRDQVDPEVWHARNPWDLLIVDGGSLGGPDFSCFLLTRAGHQAYRFDERFQPAYFEDNDYHRRLWLGGDGAKIAGLPIPYLHLGGQTVKGQSEEARVRWARKFEQVQARYVAKWGGLPHQERRITPDSTEDFDGVGTPGGYLNGEYPVVVEGRVIWETPEVRVDPA